MRSAVVIAQVLCEFEYFDFAHIDRHLNLTSEVTHDAGSPNCQDQHDKRRMRLNGDETEEETEGVRRGTRRICVI